MCGQDNNHTHTHYWLNISYHLYVDSLLSCRYIYIYIDTIYEYRLYAVILDWLYVNHEKTVAFTILPQSGSSGYLPLPLHVHVTQHGPAVVLGEIRNRNTEVYLYIFVSWPIFVCFDMDTDVDVGSRNRHLGRHVGILTDRGVKVLISVITCTWRFLLNWRNWVYEKKIRQKIRTRAIIWTNQVLSGINQDQVTHHWLIMCTCVVIIKLKKIIKRGKNSRHVE